MRSGLVCLVLAACSSSNSAHPDAAPPNIDSPTHGDAGADAPVRVDGAPDGALDGALDGAPDGMPTGVSQIWAVGDFVTNGTQVAARFASTDTPPITTFAATAPGGTAVIGPGAVTFDVTPDGTKTAYTADKTTAGTFNLYVADRDGANATLLVAGQAGIEITAIALSPDGTKVAYTADSLLANNAYDLYVVNTTGTPTPVKVSPARAVSLTPNALNVSTRFTWSSDSKYLAFSGDLDVDKALEGYLVDTTAATPAAVTVLAAADITTPSTGVSGTLQFNSANANVYFLASVDGTTNFKLFSATVAGTRTDLTASMPLRGDNSVPDIGSIAISNDRTKLVFTADAPTATNYDMYVTPLAAIAPVKITNLTAAGHASFTIPLAFSPDDTHVAYIGAFAAAGVNEPMVTALDGTDTHRLFAITVTNADAELLQWSLDGKAVYVQGDLEVNNDTKLYKVDPAMTDQALTLAVDVPTGGDVQNILVRP